MHALVKPTTSRRITQSPFLPCVSVEVCRPMMVVVRDHSGRIALTSRSLFWGGEGSRLIFAAGKTEEKSQNGNKLENKEEKRRRQSTDQHKSIIHGMRKRRRRSITRVPENKIRTIKRANFSVFSLLSSALLRPPIGRGHHTPAAPMSSSSNQNPFFRSMVEKKNTNPTHRIRRRDLHGVTLVHMTDR